MKSRWDWWVHGETIKEPLHYRECGLDDVYLLNGYEPVETPYGEGISVKNVDGLRKAIAHRLVTRKKMLAGKEIRFLRKQMDITQSELGRLFGTDSQTVARWEKEETRIPGPAERLLRALYLEHSEGKVGIEDMLRLLDELDAQINERHVLEQTDDGWRSAA